MYYDVLKHLSCLPSICHFHYDMIQLQSTLVIFIAIWKRKGILLWKRIGTPLIFLLRHIFLRQIVNRSDYDDILLA